MTDFSRGPVSSLSLSPSAQSLVAAAGRDHICIIPVPSIHDQSPQSLPPNPNLTSVSSISSVCYADDSTVYASDGTGSWTRFQTNLSNYTLSPQYTVRGAHGGAELTCITAISSISPIVTSGRDASIRLWDPETKQSITRLTGHKYEVRAVSMASSHDAQTPVTLIASAGRDKTVRLWDVRASKGSNVHVFQGHTGWVHDVAIASSPSPLIVSCAGDKTVRVWDLVAGKERNVFRGHEYRVWAVAIAPDAGFALSASTDATVRLWDLNEPSKLNDNENILEGHQDTVLTVAADRYGRFAVSGCEDGTLYRWKCPDVFVKDVEIKPQQLISIEDDKEVHQENDVTPPPGLDTKPLTVEKEENHLESLPVPVNEKPFPISPVHTEKSQTTEFVSTIATKTSEQADTPVANIVDRSSPKTITESNTIKLQKQTVGQEVQSSQPTKQASRSIPPITASVLQQEKQDLKAALASGPEQDSQFDKSAAELVSALQRIQELEKLVSQANEDISGKDKEIKMLNSTITKQSSEISKLNKKVENSERLLQAANVRNMLEKNPKKADVTLDYDEPVNKIGAVSDQLTALAARLDAMIATN